MTDITENFIAASSQLETGQLIKDEYFTLFEAVGALEIMDPKMDTGVVRSDVVDNDMHDPAAILTGPEVIWIMDELVCLEVVWLEEYPLSQTLFTSVHIDRILDPENQYPFPFELYPTEIQSMTNQVLHPYCLAVVKCTSMILELVRSQGFYEEEDFISHTFGRELLPDLSTDETLARLEEASRWVLSNVSDVTVRHALEARLEFRRTFMRSIFGQVNGWHDMIQFLRIKFDDGRTVSIATPTAFTDKVQRHLATSTPPRPPFKVTWEQARDKWIKLCDDVVEAPRLTSFWIRQSPACLQHAVWVFAARRPGALPRAIIQDIVFVDGKIADETSHFDLLLTDLRELVLAGHALVDPDSFEVEALTDDRHRCSRTMERFLDGMLDEYLNLYRLLCQNRARIRRDLTRSIKIWEILETQHAAKYDAEIATIIPPVHMDTILGKHQSLKPLQSWTKYYKLKIMAETIHLGFETDIYLPDEFAHMYYYLSTLLTQRHELLQHMETFTLDRAKTLKRVGKTRHLTECLISLQWFAALKAELDISMHLATALHLLCMLLLDFGLLHVPKRAVAQTDLLHEARMKIYLCVNEPKTPSPDDFLAARTLTGPSETTMGRIEDHIRLARVGVAALKTISAETAKYIGTEDQWRATMKALDTTAVATLVAVTQLKRAQAKAADNHLDIELMIPPLDKRYHEWWTVPQLKAKQ